MRRFARRFGALPRHRREALTRLTLIPVIGTTVGLIAVWILEVI